MNETDKSGTLFADEGPTVICGIDEAGRGPLAGPLVVVGLIMQSPVENQADSKTMS
jgi:ribonuclease HII